MKILVTGATGFVGRAICETLENAGEEIIEVGGRGKKRETGTPRTAGKNIRRLDIADPSQVNGLQAVGQVDFIVHCAGLAHQSEETARDEFYRVNVGGTENIISLAADLKVSRVILISSVSVYGTSDTETQINLKGLNEKSKCRPENSYAESKLAAEQAAIELCGKHQIKLTILRLATVIGENDAGNVRRLIEAVDRRRFYRIGNGSNRKSLVYKDDVGLACLTVIRRSSRCRTEIFNISAEPLSIDEIISVIGKHLDVKVWKFIFPTSVLRFFLRLNDRSLKLKSLRKLSETLEKWLSGNVYSAEKIALEYGFTARLTAEEGLARECADYLEKK